MAEDSSAQPVGGNAVKGLKVIECGEGISSAFGAKLLADLGADVIKVEPLEGDFLRRRGPFPGDEPNPEASGIFLYLNANKRGVTLDLGRSEDRRAFGALLQRAGVLIHNVVPNRRAELGLASADLTRTYPALVVAASSR